jgi:hypothetical protein
MKTTLDIDDQILAKAKAVAARERTTLTRLVEEGLSLRLRTTRPALPVFDGTGGVVKGTDPRSNQSLYDAADEDDGR